MEEILFIFIPFHFLSFNSIFISFSLSFFLFMDL